MLDNLLKEIRREMPSIVTRNHPKFKEWTGIGGRRMANLDSLGQGPEKRVLLGRTIAYPRDSLLAWIANRLKAAPCPQRRDKTLSQATPAA
jgi:hypothetical protein